MVVIRTLNMQVDEQMVAHLSLQIHYLQLTPMQAAVEIGLLCLYLGMSVLAAVIGVAFILWIIVVWMKKSNGYQFLIMGMKDKGMKALNEILNNMRVIKFQASATVAVLAAVYMKLFLVESDNLNECTQPLIPRSDSDADFITSPKLLPIKKVSSLGGMICLLQSSLTLLQASLITFFGSIADNGFQASFLFLKAKYQFDKDQFADLLLIVGIAGAFSQLLLMPTIAPFIREDKLPSIGLLACCTHIFIYSISSASWVPYLASTFVVLSGFVPPCIRSLVFKKVGSHEQGMAQGCITSIRSLASILSPFVFTPLKALFLSKNPPFNFKGDFAVEV